MEEIRVDEEASIPFSLPRSNSKKSKLKSKEKEEDASSVRSSTASLKKIKNAANKKRTSSSFVEKALDLKNKISDAREDLLDLKQEVKHMKEYSNTKINRLNNQISVLLDSTRKIDESSLNAEYSMAFLKKERKKLFNDLLSIKGNIRVFCRIRPQFENEGLMATSFPDEFCVRINPTSQGGFIPASARKDFEFDHVYGPHVSQADLFNDIQPIIQSVLDGYNASIIAYGQTGAGKTHTMEGLSHDRGIYYRSFDEMFDLSTSNMFPSSSYLFQVSVIEIYNEMFRDLLNEEKSKIYSKSFSFQKTEDDNLFLLDVIKQRISNTVEYTKLIKSSFERRMQIDGWNLQRNERSHLIVTIHVEYMDRTTEEKFQSKLHMVDLAGSNRIGKNELSGDLLTESLYINKSLSALGDVLNAITAKKNVIPFQNSRFTQVLSDSIGGESKTLLIVNCSPTNFDVPETISSLNFAARARNVEMSLGSKDTIKKWRDMANEARHEFYEKEKECGELHEEMLQLKNEINDLKNEIELTNESNISLQTEISTLQIEYQGEITQLQMELQAQAEKFRRNEIELRMNFQEEMNEVLEKHSMQMKSMKDSFETEFVLLKANLEAGNDKKLQTLRKERDKTVSILERKIENLETLLAESSKIFETQLYDARNSLEAAVFATKVVDSSPLSANYADSALQLKYEMAVERNAQLEDELARRDDLIKRLHEENERFFIKSIEKESILKSENSQKDKINENNNSNNNDNLQILMTTKDEDGNILSSPSPSSPSPLDDSTMKKITPAGNYLNNGLKEFDVESYPDIESSTSAANHLLELILTAFSKAGSDQLSHFSVELYDTVMSFIKKYSKVLNLNGILISNIIIHYIQNLISQSADLNPHDAIPIQQFLEKVNSAKSNTSPKGQTNSTISNFLSQNSNANEYEKIETFKLDIFGKGEKKGSQFKLFKSGKMDLKIIDSTRLKEIYSEALVFAIGNNSLAKTFIHYKTNEIRRGIHFWIEENFDFFSVNGLQKNFSNEISPIVTSIFDGFLCGLGTEKDKKGVNAIGQLFEDLTLKFYLSKMKHIDDISSTLIPEEVDDVASVTRLRSALESIAHKHKNISQDMKSDPALKDKTEIPIPPFSGESRLTSVLTLEEILKSCDDLCQSKALTFSAAGIARSKILFYLNEKLHTLNENDKPLAESSLLNAQKFVDAASPRTENKARFISRRNSTNSTSTNPATTAKETFSDDLSPEIPQILAGETLEWHALQLNNRKDKNGMIVVRCAATSSLDLVVKIINKHSSSTEGINPSPPFEIAILPVPMMLDDLNLEGMKKELSQVPESLRAMSMAKTAENTKERYSRLYKSLAARIPAMRKALGMELEDYLPGGQQSWSQLASGQTTGQHTPQRSTSPPGERPPVSSSSSRPDA